MRSGHGKFKRLLGIVAAAGTALGLNIAPAHAYPANGTFMGAVHFSIQCSSGIGVGVAFDGTYLWYTCYASGATPDLLRADPKTGLVSYFTTIDNGLGAIAYDATRNAIWAAPGGGNHYGAIWLISLDAAHTVTSSVVQFNAGNDADGLTDGLGFDATDDTLYFKPDNSNPIHHYKTNGTKLADINGYPSCDGPGTSGLAIGGDLLFEGKDGCSHVYVVDKHTLALAFDFSTQIAGDPNFRDEGLSCDNVTFSPVDVMWSKEAYSPMRASAFSIPSGTCGVGGQPPPPSDQAITATGQNISATEGQNFSGPVATFTDPDPMSTAAEYSASINWGDGSPASAGVITGPVGGPFTVSGDHVYAEEGSYTVTVTITDIDNPGNTATTSATATVADAALSSKCTMPPVITPTFAGSTAEFDDSATTGSQADFTATINWGDHSSSTGTIAGGPGLVPYDVSGSHTYSSTGSFTVTTTINDDGGATTTATCTVLVAGFPTANGGTFVVGDLEAMAPPMIGNSLTWWSSQWAIINQMSGGPAPSSMKGFAGFEDMPLPSPLPPLTKLCGMTWTTDTGNATPPPPSVPADMLVFVSSHIVQNGSIVSGDIKEVIAVKNDPGYAPDPGHTGSGTEEAIVCTS